MVQMGLKHSDTTSPKRLEKKKIRLVSMASSKINSGPWYVINKIASQHYIPS